MTSARLFFVAASIAALLTASAVVQAETITLDAVQDSYIRSYSTYANSTYDNLGVRISNSSSSDRSIGLYQFDLSGLSGDILSAHVELYDLGTGGAQSSAFAVVHYIVTPDVGATNEELTVLNSNNGVAFDEDGMHEEYATYNAYAAAVDTSGYWNESPTSSMRMDIAANNEVGYYNSVDADEDALTLLNANKNDKGYVVLLGWRTTGKRLFDDREGGYAPRLVVDVVPEPGTFVLLAGLGCLAAMLRGRKE